MSLSPREIAFLQDLVAKDTGHKAASVTSRHLQLHYAIGQHSGSRFLFNSTDAQRAAQTLRNAGIPLSAAAGPLRRAEAALKHPSLEKSGTLAPHTDSVAVRCAHGACSLDGQPLATTGYQVLTLAQAARAARGSADVIMVVENLESLRFLERARWIDYQGRSVMALYRGDNVFRANAAMGLLGALAQPTWGYFDFDPAGLGMAAQLPRLERIVLPQEAQLVEAVRRSRQVHLYADQMDQWGATLQADSRELVRAPWELLKRLRMGLAQEVMDGTV